MILQARQRVISFPRRPLLMGIVNINDDSFCGDGTLDSQEALRLARAQIEAGADVIDVGAESARTNRGPISIDEEIQRLAPFLRRFPDMSVRTTPRDDEQVWPPLLSINTWRPEVAEAMAAIGYDLLNDLGALSDPKNAEICAEIGAALLIMHTVGEPKEARFHERYDDLWTTLENFFACRIATAKQAGLSDGQIVLDPGIDFAKQQVHNLAIYRDLHRLTERFAKHPWLLPISRKTLVGEVLHLPDPADRDAGTVACLTAGVLRGAALFRVHNVSAMYEALKVLWAFHAT